MENPFPNFETSPSIKALSKKLADVQKSAISVKKNKANPFFKSTYATLGQYLDNLLPLWDKVGLIVNQYPAGSVLVTSITDVDSGEFIRFGYPIIVQGKTPQEIAGQITYARRYALAGAFMVNTEDDDGNTASGNATKTNSEPTNSDDLPWLKKPSMEYTNIVKAIQAKTIKSVPQIRLKYKVNKEIAAELEELISLSNK